MPTFSSFASIENKAYSHLPLVLGNGLGNPSLHKVAGVSFSLNAFGKSMNASPSPIYGYIREQTVLFNFGKATNLGERKVEFKTCTVQTVCGIGLRRSDRSGTVPYHNKQIIWFRFWS